MKKAAFAGGLVVTLNPTLVPGPQHLARAHAELQLLCAGFTSSQAEVGADLLLRRLNIVVDLDPDGSWTATGKRDTQSAKAVSKKCRNAFGGGGGETPISRHPAAHTVARGGGHE